MTCFIDTSALLAILDKSDTHHKKAAKQFENLINQDDTLICSNYILLETFALVQRRIGMDALRAFQESLVPIMTIEWVGEEVHQAAAASVLTAGRKKLSLVDCSSFTLMRRLGIKTAFTFDKHFREQGFQCIP